MNDTLSRRDFTKQLGTIGFTLALAGRTLRANPANDLPIGIQLYTVRDHLAKDFLGTLKRVNEIGYKQFEFAGYGGMEAADLLLFLQEKGIGVCGTHEGFENFSRNPEPVIAYNKAIGNANIIVPSMPGSVRNGGVAGVEKFAYTLNTLGYQAKKEGIIVGYHNHSFEFEKIDGERTIWDVLFGALDQELVKAEMDVAWVANAGVDPVALMEKYAGRIVSLHMKDLDKNKELAPVGEGVIDMKRVIKTARQIGVKWYIVEQDSTRKGKEIMDEIAISYKNLAALLS